MARQSKRIIRRPKVENRTGLGRAAIYQKIAEGKFPKPVPLGDRAVGWIEEEIDAWIEGRIEARDQREVA